MKPMPIIRKETVSYAIDDTEPCIFLATKDLFDQTVLLCLYALEMGMDRCGVEPKDDRGCRIIASGMVLAAEAWRRGLISAPTPPPSIPARTETERERG